LRDVKMGTNAFRVGVPRGSSAAIGRSGAFATAPSGFGPGTALTAPWPKAQPRPTTTAKITATTSTTAATGRLLRNATATLDQLMLFPPSCGPDMGSEASGGEYERLTTETSPYGRLSHMRPELRHLSRDGGSRAVL